MPPPRQKHIRLPLEAFPESFRTDLARYVTSLEHPDPFDLEARTVALRPTSIRRYQSDLIRFASILVHSGLDIGKIESLATLVDLTYLERGLRWMLAQNNGQTRRGISAIGELMRTVGRFYLRLPEDEQRALEQLVGRITLKPQQGITSKNRERLRPLEDSATLRRLLMLPEQLFERASACGPIQGARLRETALIIAILLHCPIRRKNLASVQLDRNLQRPRDGRTFLVFEAEEVKNRHRIEFELPRHVVELIDRHLATRSPALCPPGTPWLFPRRDGSAPIDLSHLSNNVSRTIRKETGLAFNMHLFRHLAAMLWLEARPGAYEVVRRLLGHSQLSHTLSVYAGLEAGTATRLFADVIEAARQK